MNLHDLPNIETAVRLQLNESLTKIEQELECDFLAINSPIRYGLEQNVRAAIESLNKKRQCLTVVLTTPGGIVQVVERLVELMRHHYDQVNFVVPDYAMSAGTILALSGDEIYMDYFSRLGPIDPQIQKGDQLVPALSYLLQYERLGKKAQAGEFTAADAVLLQKLDLAELDLYEQARELSITLLKKWLSVYKFKNWTEFETRKLPVGPEDRENRAREIAAKLNDPHLWHSHSRAISMHTLRSELNLKINDLAEKADLHRNIMEYHSLLGSYMDRHGRISFVHTREFF